MDGWIDGEMERQTDSMVWYGIVEFNVPLGQIDR